LIFQSIWKDFHHKSLCYISYTLLTRHYWFDVALGICYGITTLSVFGLLLEQIYCIITNKTINEMIIGIRKRNESIDEEENIFDEGCLGNILDFFRLSHYKNYYKIFEVERERDSITDASTIVSTTDSSTNRSISSEIR